MGATIYPLKEDISEMPYSEVSVYEFLEKLSDKYIIFHSVRWLKRNNKWKSTWKENDFLILNRNLGALVLEVKGGEIETDGTIFKQINSETGESADLDPEKRNDPLSQAIDGIYHYRKMLSREVCRGIEDRFPVEAAVWFSKSEIADKRSKFPLPYREAEGAVLGYEDFKRGPKAIYDIFDFYKSHDKVDITDDEFNKIVEAIANDFELITAPGALKDELDHVFLKLTNEQAGLLDYISEQKYATIQGVAGTGKALIAKEAAKRFGQEGRKVLFLCFNRLLFSYLKKTYPYENVTYYNIHSIISEYGTSIDDTYKPQDRAAALLKIDWDKLDFEDIVIDEAQDFLNDEIIYFKNLAELRDGHFFAFYDKNQLLTTDSVPEWIKDSECKLLLTKNCRNTYEIALTAYNVIDVELNQKVVMINGKDTTLTFAKGNPISQLTALINYLTSDQNGFEYSDITILSLKPESESILNEITKISGIPILRERSNSGIFFTTSMKFKGLESRAVIITDIDENSFLNEKIKRNFYVACSRATHYLSLFITGDDEKFKAIANAIGGSSHFAPQGRIAMKTKSKILNL